MTAPVQKCCVADDRMTDGKCLVLCAPCVTLSCCSICTDHNINTELKKYCFVDFYLLGKGSYVFGGIGLSVCLFVYYLEATLFKKS